MNVSFNKFLCSALVCSVSLTAALPVQAYESPLHVFSINDVQGDFAGNTYATDPSIICGITDEATNTIPTPCTGIAMPFFDKEGIELFPVDSTFGFYVVDFLGAREKIRDNDYGEGWVGNITYDGEVVGVKVSNAKTDKYKVRPPFGTWCQGLGGTSIKCSTEHYSSLEHVLSCHEVIPYMQADPDDGTQALLEFPSPYTDTFDCTNAGLDDDLLIIEDGGFIETYPGSGVYEQLTSVIPGEDMDANDNTTVMDDIAVSSDYSVTLKDDGKPLYRWGGMIKRPNDMRFYAKLDLPQAWKTEVPDPDNAGEMVLPRFKVTKAHLIVTHWITNNPNDQLRPEDLENEAATGRKPDYEIDSAGNWLSTGDCYEGDTDFIPTGTVLKNAVFAGNPYGDDAPQVFSSDLVGGFTNAFYTTTNRDPFEWSYRVLGSENMNKFEGRSSPLTPGEALDAGLELVSGPRWRLKANKFGQDIPGLEIPLQECSPPPFQHDNIKYQVGEMVTTVIDLLDWADENSPLAYSDGWVDASWKGEDYDPLTGLSVNGLPMSEDFDLAVYIKGDRKPTALYTAKLEIDYIDESLDPAPPSWDVAITDVKFTETIYIRPDDDDPETPPSDIQSVAVLVENYGPYQTPVEVELACVDKSLNEWVVQPNYFGDVEPPYPLENDEDKWFYFTVIENTAVEKPATVDCIAEAIAEGDVYLPNNTADFTFKVKKDKEYK